MLYFYSGTDRDEARSAMKKAIDVMAKKGTHVLRISDANSVEDLATALRGEGMFGEKRVVVLEGILNNDEMREIFLGALPSLKESTEELFLFEEKPDAATRKLLEKHATMSERFDAVKKAEMGTTIFALANALKRADKKALWVAYQQELLRSAPEAIHGVLFWGAKDMYLKSHSDAEKNRAQKIIAELADLPHRSRHRGMELEYALEQFVLTSI